jgi:hypothetical protein
MTRRAFLRSATIVAAVPAGCRHALASPDIPARKAEPDQRWNYYERLFHDRMAREQTPATIPDQA